jgi:hypothetical protein
MNNQGGYKKPYQQNNMNGGPTAYKDEQYQQYPQNQRQGGGNMQYGQIKGNQYNNRQQRQQQHSAGN